MISSKLLTLTYSESVRFINVGYYSFNVISTNVKKIIVGSYSDSKIVSAVRKLESEYVEFLNFKDGISKEDKEKTYYNIGMKKSDSIQLISYSSASIFLVSGSFFGGIVTSIFTYKKGYFFDSSNKITVKRHFFSGISYNGSVKIVKREIELTETIAVLKTIKTSDMRSFISKSKQNYVYIKIPKSDFYNIINTKTNINRSMFSNIARVYDYYDRLLTTEISYGVYDYYQDFIYSKFEEEYFIEPVDAIFPVSVVVENPYIINGIMSEYIKALIISE